MRALAVLPPDRWMEANLLDTLRQHYCDELHVFTYPGGMGQLGSKQWRAQRNELNRQLGVVGACPEGSREPRSDLLYCL